MVLKNWVNVWKKANLNLYLTLYAKVSSTWIIDISEHKS